MTIGLFIRGGVRALKDGALFAGSKACARCIFIIALSLFIHSLTPKLGSIQKTLLEGGGVEAFEGGIQISPFVGEGRLNFVNLPRGTSRF